MKTHEFLYAEIRTQNMLPDRSTDVVNDEPSQTNQQFLQECDINHIVDQSRNTGFIGHLNNRTPQWGDFGESTDYHSALNYLKEANESFMSLPAEVRARFENDPAQLLDFINNPENLREAVDLGLADVPKNGFPAPKQGEPNPAPKTPKNAPELPQE